MTRDSLVPGTDVEVLRWRAPTGDGECTVVWLPIERLDPDVASTEVTPRERDRAAGYTRERDRLLSLGSAWLTRRLVADMLGVAALDAPITRDCASCPKPHGRPVVPAQTNDGATVHVSATHTRGLVGVALSTSGPVGLDVENLHARGPQAWPTVWRVLGRPPAPESPAGTPVAARTEAARTEAARTEAARTEAARTEAARTAATAWVRIEAVLKATGYGLAVSSRSVDITAGGNPRVIRWPWGDPTGRVSLFDLSPGHPYLASLAVIHGEPTGFTSRAAVES